MAARSGDLDGGSHAHKKRHSPGTARATPRYLRSLRLPALVLELASAGGEGLATDDLLARPILRRLYISTGDALRQAFNRDLRTLCGTTLRELKRDGDGNSAAAHDGTLPSLVTYNTVTSRYQLRTPLPIPTLRLTPTALDTLCLLIRYVRGGQILPGAAELFENLIAGLPSEQQVELQRVMGGEVGVGSVLTLDVGPLGTDVLDWDVLRGVLHAVQKRQCLDFDYRPLGSTSEHITRHRDDEVLEVRVADHVYITVWCETVGRELDLRLDRIVAGTLHISPRSVADHRRRGVAIRYWLAPKIASGGVSVRLEEQQVERQPDGSAIVSGKARSLFWAEQLLLKYGPSARALEPQRLVERMRQTVAAMGEQYRVVEPGRVQGESSEDGRSRLAPETGGAK